mmetsp:Transcript_67975/g.199647  ORF Transcript_67975/g.199647 Transcript_67975/m.199647 type:complete len:248 (+) Transcript_67975:156-899(+)
MQMGSGAALCRLAGLGQRRHGRVRLAGRRLVPIACAAPDAVRETGVSVPGVQALDDVVQVVRAELAARERRGAVLVLALGKLRALLVAHAKVDLLVRQADALLVRALPLSLFVAGDVVARAHPHVDPLVPEAAVRLRAAGERGGAMGRLAVRQQRTLLVAPLLELLLVLSAEVAVVLVLLRGKRHHVGVEDLLAIPGDHRRGRLRGRRGVDLRVRDLPAAVASEALLLEEAVCLPEASAAADGPRDA